MEGKNTKHASAAAQACGMSEDKWSEVKVQAHAARTRGRRAQAEKKLTSWRVVDGQEALFDTDDATTD